MKLHAEGNIVDIYDAKEGIQIIREKDKTLSYLIVRVDDPDATVIIDVDARAKFIMSPKQMYELGLTRRMEWFPWVQTYDDTNNVYVIIFEPDLPLAFRELKVAITPTKPMTYSYAVGYIEGYEYTITKLEQIRELTSRILSRLRVGTPKKGR